MSQIQWTMHRCCEFFAATLLLTSASLAHAVEQSRELRQWQMVELEFMAHRKYAEPMSVQITASFSGPDGTILEVPGFWDGGSKWKIRFTPPLPGGWRYVTSALNRDDDG